MKKVISIVNYSTGNISSVKRVIEHLGYETKIIDTYKSMVSAETLVLPGVGHFGRAMETLRQKDLIEPLNEAVLEKKTPIVGICLGMQLMTQGSEEGSAEGLGWFDCKVTKLMVNDSLRFKVPHMGWNHLEKNEHIQHNLVFDSEEKFYFAHSFHVKEAPENQILSYSNYESTFVSSIIKNNIIGFQFHPEKSQGPGRKLLDSAL